MAKISVYECDICKTQSKKIYSVKVEIASALLSNGDNKPTTGNPINFDCEVCSFTCAAEALARTFKKLKGEVAVFPSRTDVLPLATKSMS
jgi:hypothetical protein